MFILRKAIRAITSKARKERSIAQSISSDSEIEEAWSIQREPNESESSSFISHFHCELKEPALVDVDSDAPHHMLAGADSEEYDNGHFGFEYLTPEPKVSICTSSDTAERLPSLRGAQRWADLSEDLLSFRPEPPCEDILETYLRNKREFATFVAVDKPSSSSLKPIGSIKRKQVITTGPLLEVALTKMIFEPSTFHHRSTR